MQSFLVSFFLWECNINSLIPIGKKIPGAEGLLLFGVHSFLVSIFLWEWNIHSLIPIGKNIPGAESLSFIFILSASWVRFDYSFSAHWMLPHGQTEIIMFEVFAEPKTFSTAKIYSPSVCMWFRMPLAFNYMFEIIIWVTSEQFLDQTRRSLWKYGKYGRIQFWW